jgi:hypothetical protein
VGSELVLVIVIAAAVSFDFTNGFHDTANAMATSIATGALKPIVAVLISAALNFLGAFISISAATTIAKGIVPTSATAGVDGLFVVEAALPLFSPPPPPTCSSAVWARRRPGRATDMARLGRHRSFRWPMGPMTPRRRWG